MPESVTGKYTFVHPLTVYNKMDTRHKKTKQNKQKITQKHVIVMGAQGISAVDEGTGEHLSLTPPPTFILAVQELDL